MIENIRLSNLPGYARLFVGVLAALSLIVSLWGATALYMSTGIKDEYGDAAYTGSDRTASGQPAPKDKVGRGAAKNLNGLKEDVVEITEDSAAVLAPIWDTEHAGKEAPVDSATLVEEFLDEDADLAGVYVNGEYRLRYNISQAYMHLVGQTLVFLALGLVFLFTSVSPRLKKIVWWVLGVSIVLFAIGLSCQGYGRFFCGMQATAGAVMLLTVVFMTLRIYIDLARKRENKLG
jgi:hypothetical protein